MNPKAQLPESANQESLQTLIESIDRAADESGFSVIEKTGRDKCITALFLRSCGYSVAEVRRRTGLHHVTVAKLEDRHSEAFEMLKRQTAMGVALAAEKAVQLLSKKIDQLSEDPEALAKVNVKDVAITAGVAIDKRNVLTGEATEIRRPRPQITFEDYQRIVREAQAERAGRKADGKVVEIGGAGER